MMGWARVDESGAELGGRGSTHVQRCREWVDGTACGRPGDDGLRRYVVHVLIRRRLAAAANDAARLCEAASGRAWRLTPARHCASCASTSVEVDASRSERITEMPEPAFADMIPRPDSSVSVPSPETKNRPRGNIR